VWDLQRIGARLAPLWVWIRAWKIPGTRTEPGLPPAWAGVNWESSRGTGRNQGSRLGARHKSGTSGGSDIGLGHRREKTGTCNSCRSQHISETSEEVSRYSAGLDTPKPRA
ncbi:hypothetical protein LEMLEM_LOCUS4839, partial [Lemmus lemmus]